MCECMKRQGPDCAPIVDKAIIVTPSSLVKVTFAWYKLLLCSMYCTIPVTDFLDAHVYAELAEGDREVVGWSATDSRSGQRRQGDHREGARI